MRLRMAWSSKNDLHFLQPFQNSQFLTWPLNLADAALNTKTVDCSLTSDLTGVIKLRMREDGQHLRRNGQVTLDTAMIE